MGFDMSELINDCIKPNIMQHVIEKFNHRGNSPIIVGCKVVINSTFKMQILPFWYFPSYLCF